MGRNTSRNLRNRRRKQKIRNKARKQGRPPAKAKKE